MNQINMAKRKWGMMPEWFWARNVKLEIRRERGVTTPLVGCSGRFGPYLPLVNSVCSEVQCPNFFPTYVLSRSFTSSGRVPICTGSTYLLVISRDIGGTSQLLGCGRRCFTAKNEDVGVFGLHTHLLRTDSCIFPPLLPQASICVF